MTHQQPSLVVPRRRRRRRCSTVKVLGVGVIFVTTKKNRYVTIVAVMFGIVVFVYTNIIRTILLQPNHFFRWLPYQYDDQSYYYDLHHDQSCLVHEATYIPNVIRNPRQQQQRNSSSGNGTSSTTTKSGEYLIHPTPPLCGTLLRNIWKTGYTIMMDHTMTNTTTTTTTTNNTTTDTANNIISYEMIERHQSNCQLPVQLFHIDNQNGIGAHLHLWSQAYCNAATTATATTADTMTTTNASEQQQQSISLQSLPVSFRIKTVNPNWLWSDQTYCRNHHQNTATTTTTTTMMSPFTCYFPKMEDRCPDDTNHHIQQQQQQSLPNVTSPYHHQLRCSTLQSSNHNQQKHNRGRDPDPDPDFNTTTTSNNNTDTSVSDQKNQLQLLSQYRAATTEFIFQSIHPIIVQEAERHIGLLFSNPTDDTTTRANGTIRHDRIKTKKGNYKPITVPSDLITVHLRWGDKFFEMDLVSIEEYVQAIVDMLHIIHGSSSSSSSTPMVDNSTGANIYLACEDPIAVQEFIHYTTLYYPHWKIYVDRTVTELTAFRPAKGNRASWTTRNTMGRAGLMALGSLLVALEAKYYILTTGSNWSRLINELRTNVIEKRCCATTTSTTGSCTHMIDLRPGEW